MRCAVTERQVPQTAGFEADSDSRANSADIVQFHRSLSEAGIDLLIWLGCGALVIAAMIFQFFESGETYWAYVALVLLLPIVAIVYNWFRMRHRRDLEIEIGHEGLRLPTHTTDVIRWKDISSLRTNVKTIRGGASQTQLMVHVDDPTGYERVARGPVQRLNDRYCNWWYGAPFALWLDPLEGEPADVVEAIEQRAPKALLKNSDLSLWD